MTAKIGGSQPSVVVIDINMPRMNGIEATRQIKQRFPAIIVIGLSVQSDQESQSAMMKAGASLFLTKEAAVNQLYDAMKGVRQTSLLLAASK